MHVGGRGHAVLMPVDPKGLNPSEITLPRLLKKNGYATACVGKWHLGDQPPFLPTRHGFDSFFGCPYSEDMVPTDWAPERPPLPLMRDEVVLEAPVDRYSLTRRYTEESIRFIRENRERPFFLYLAQAMPGSTDRPFPGKDFADRSANGPYGDAIEELDWSCGEIMRTLEELDLGRNTLVIWTSDNGAVHWDPEQGSNAPLRGWGYDTSEGAQRVPCIARWPGRVPAGVVDDRVVTMMDILPTVAAIAGVSVPDEPRIDGYDIRPLLFGAENAESSYDRSGFFYYHMHQLQAVRAGQWKLYLPLDNKVTNLCADYTRGLKTPAELYDVRNDLPEKNEVSATRPDVCRRLMAMAEAARRELGDWDREGSGQRPAGRVDRPTPRLMKKPATP